MAGKARSSQRREFNSGIVTKIMTSRNSFLRLGNFSIQRNTIYWAQML